MVPWHKRGKRGSGGEAHILFLSTPFLPQENTLFEHRNWLFLHEKAVKNKKAEMKESRQNDREVRVQEDNITENTDARFNT